MRKLRTRILVGGAIAVFAGAAAFAVTSTADATTTAKTTVLAGTTAKAGATAKTGTTLSITAGGSTVKGGGQDSISGTLLAGGSPAANRVVELYRYNSRSQKWRPVRIKLTSKAGAVMFTVRPEVTREYELVYHGNSTLAAATSSAVTVTVSPPAAKRVTNLSVSAAPASVAAGHPATIAGVLTVGARPLARRAVSLYRYDAAGKQWVRVAVARTGPRGGVRFVREPSATATFELGYAGGPALTAAHSAKATVTVTG
jgi:hypothetical protein